MKLVRTYVMREYMIVLSYCVLGLCLIHVIIDMFNNASKMIDAGPPWHMVLRYYVSYLSPSLELLLPAALLLATLFTLWQLARHHELVAMQASGISLTSVLSTFLKVGLVTSILLAMAKETVIPSAARWASDFQKSNFTASGANRTTPLSYMNSRDHRLWNIREFSPKQPNRLKGVKVTQQRPNGSREFVIEAERVEWLDGEWCFYINTPPRYFTEDDAPRKDAESPIEHETVRSMPFTETPRDFAAMATPPEYQTAFEMKRYMDHHTRLSRSVLAEKWTNFHSHLAMPWACLIVTLFGIPVGARTARQSILTGVFLAIGLFFCFYALNQVGVFLAKNGTLPAIAGAWLSNVVFLLVGLVLLCRTH